ncbi:secondary active sulfate transmembrane transporter [Aureococcus anophagefferens]|nr:secondary active sulfate transmembrane transporter [Aureococcus anophagefferens]
MACPNESFLWREQLVEPLPAAAHVRARALLKRPTTKPCASYPQPPPRKWWAQAPRDATGFLVAFFTEAVLNVVFAGAVFSGAPALRGDAPASLSCGFAEAGTRRRARRGLARDDDLERPRGPALRRARAHPLRLRGAGPGLHAVPRGLRGASPGRGGAEGCGLLFDWFAAPLAKLDAAETAVVVVIVLTMVSAGLLRGVALGAACSFGLLAANAFKVLRAARAAGAAVSCAACGADVAGAAGRREGGGFDVEFFATLDGALDAAEDALLRRRGVDGASLGACVARTPATLHFVAVREVTALERDDPRAALALYKVVASVNTAIANRCKMALGRMADGVR